MKRLYGLLVGFLLLAVLATAQNVKLGSGVKVGGAGGAGYIIPFFGGSLSPGNGVTQYLGQLAPISFQNAAASIYVEAPTTGTIKRMSVHLYVGGTKDTAANDITFSIDNATAATGGMSCTLTAYSTIGHDCTDSVNTLAVTAGDKISLKWVTPTFTTPPTTVAVSAMVYIE